MVQSTEQLIKIAENENDISPNRIEDFGNKVYEGYQQIEKNPDSFGLSKNPTPAEIVRKAVEQVQRMDRGD